jgi:hypothetical protein
MSVSKAIFKEKNEILPRLNKLKDSIDQAIQNREITIVLRSILQYISSWLSKFIDLINHLSEHGKSDGINAAVDGGIYFIIQTGAIEYLSKDNKPFIKSITRNLINSNLCSLQPYLKSISEILKSALGNEAWGQAIKEYEKSIFTQEEITNKISNLYNSITSNIKWWLGYKESEKIEEFKKSEEKTPEIDKFFEILESIAKNIKPLNGTIHSIVKHISTTWSSSQKLKFIGMLFKLLHILDQRITESYCNKFKDLNEQIDNYKKILECRKVENYKMSDEEIEKSMKSLEIVKKTRESDEQNGGKKPTKKYKKHKNKKTKHRRR